ncbi:hypothetical protein H8B02_32120 [Bradyrhizobium sp. Pear77]|nr:hypothetical protein [Bradyrhizobium altum]
MNGIMERLWDRVVVGGQNEAHNHRTFCSMPYGFEHRRFRARRLEQISGAKDAGQGLQEGQPRRLRLCAWTEVCPSLTTFNGVCSRSFGGQSVVGEAARQTPKSPIS